MPSALNTSLYNSRCWNQCASEKQLLAASAYLAGQILLALDPMADVSLQTVLNDSRCWNQCASYKQLLAASAYLQFLIQNGGGGGGGGAVAALGENYCFTGTNPNQIFKIGNLNTGLSNRIDTVGADPVVDIRVDDGSAC